MKFVNLEGRATLLFEDDQVLDLEKWSDGGISSDPMIALQHLRDLAKEDFSDATELQALNGQRLGPPVPRPQKILGAGINYYNHAREAKLAVPTQPSLFAKLPSALAGPQDRIVIPPNRKTVDWEAEVVVVVGKRGKDIPEDEAWSYVAGLTCGQDISDRQEQFRDLGQFTIGKSFDTYAPTGPALVTTDELADRDDLTIVCRLNGEEVQRGQTGDCIFSVSALVSWLSHACTLEPGDLIFTGTPSGVGYIRTPPRYLADGDVLETEISGLGAMRNVCVNGAGIGES
jgi:2,4-didehydro-3-deoxy-L-rhamnonate hydrolase